MHIISASRRTDIPAFHAQWFMNRIRAGFAGVVNPFNGNYRHVLMRPKDVIGITFWTKNTEPLLDYLPELIDQGHDFIISHTINNYPKIVEPSVPDYSRIMRNVNRLARDFPENIGAWRYDTIVLTSELNASWHINNFTEICRELKGIVRRCLFSFCDFYRKTTRNMCFALPNHYKPTEDECRCIAAELANIASDCGITLESCSHDFLLSAKISRGSCINPWELFKVASTDERRVALKKVKKAPTRKECGCVASVDIGAYDTCGHGCVYCYANATPEKAKANLKRANMEAECLDPHRIPETSGGTAHQSKTGT